MADEAVLVEKASPHVAVVTINRAEVRNAVNGDVARGLERAVDETNGDIDIRVVILTGAGDRAFCAGADLKEIAAGRGAALETQRYGFAGFAYAERRKPWIAAVNGFALAGGLEIALACDLIVAAEHASFGLPEVKRGLIASAGGVYRLPRMMPRALALELIATGEPMAAARAAALGLINRVVAGDLLLPKALALAETIAANAPIAVMESLAIARAAYDLSDDELRARSAQAWLRIKGTEDFREGPKAFAEKRPAHWTGR